MTARKPLPDSAYACSPQTDPFEARLREITSAAQAPSRSGKVVLVIPPSPQIPTPGREFLVTGPFEGLTAVATLIRKMGFCVKIIDCRLKEDEDLLVLEGVKDADVIGIAAYGDSFVFLRSMTARLKREFPSKIIFLGGPLVTALPELLLSNTRADIGVLGEAELTLIELLERLFSADSMPWEDIRGIAYKKDGKVSLTPARPQIRDINTLPLSDFTVWPNFQDIVRHGQILISSMRGCPHDCSFCFKTIPALRMKSLERFEEEVAHLKKTTGFSETWLNDLTFNAVPDRAVRIAGILKKYDVKFHCFARVTKVDRALAEALKASGCLGIWFGVEAYDQDILDSNRKMSTLDEINRAIAISRAAGLQVRALFIVGLYGETEAALKNMLAFIQHTDFIPLVKHLVPFPGTSLYHHALNTGRIKDPIAFLEMLSRRKVGDHDDEIINLTDLDDSILRDYFRRIWDITRQREA